jgi:hypothetical protein
MDRRLGWRVAFGMFGLSFPYFRRYVRSAKCTACDAHGEQVIHGFTRRGRLWKRHLCACRGWQCLACGQVIDKVDWCCP